MGRDPDYGPFHWIATAKAAVNFCLSVHPSYFCRSLDLCNGYIIFFRVKEELSDTQVQPEETETR